MPEPWFEPAHLDGRRGRLGLLERGDELLVLEDVAARLGQGVQQLLLEACQLDLELLALAQQLALLRLELGQLALDGQGQQLGLQAGAGHLPVRMLALEPRGRRGMLSKPLDPHREVCDREQRPGGGRDACLAAARDQEEPKVGVKVHRLVPDQHGLPGALHRSSKRRRRRRATGLFPRAWRGRSASAPCLSH